MDYTENNKEAILDKLKSCLNEKRFLHSIGCAHCAVELAKKFNLDEKKAYVAGLLHDCAKGFEMDDMLKIAKDMGLNEDEANNFKIVHAPVSAYIAKKEYNVVDDEILSAIRWHTLGYVNMSDFEKIIFLADKIESNTRNPQHRDRILEILSEENGLNKAILICYKETIKSLVDRNLKINQTTIDIYNALLSGL